VDSAPLPGLASQLYAAVTAPEQWPALLLRISRLLHCEHGIVLTRASWHGDEIFWASSGLKEAEQARFRSSYSAQLGTPMFERSASYHEIVRPAKGFRSMNAVLGTPAESPTHATLIGFCRSRATSDFTAEETGLLQALLPDFSAALELAIRLRNAESTSHSLRAVLDVLDAGVVLVDAAAQPHFINRRGARLLGQRDGLTVSAQGLAATVPSKTAALRAAIAEVASRPAANHFGACTRRLCVPRGPLRTPLLLSVLPVARCEGLAGTPAKAAIFITEPDARASMDADLIAESFGLTRRAATVAAHLGMGLDLPDTAATLGITIGTVRAHLKQVFEKTGARSQSALVLKLRSYSRTP